MILQGEADAAKAKQLTDALVAAMAAAPLEPFESLVVMLMLALGGLRELGHTEAQIQAMVDSLMRVVKNVRAKEPQPPEG